MSSDGSSHYACGYTQPNEYTFHLLSLSGNTEPRGSGIVEDNVLALEEDIAKNVNADPGTGLETTEAGGASGVGGGVIEVAAGDDGAVGADAESQTGESGGAGEYVAAVGVGILRAGHLAVVGRHDSSRGVDEGGASIGDGVDGRGSESARSDGIAGAGEFPEALSGGDWNVGDRTGVLGRVDETEIVSAYGTLFQVDTQHWGGKGGLDVVEEGLLRRRADGVD